MPDNVNGQQREFRLALDAYASESLTITTDTSRLTASVSNLADGSPVAKSAYVTVQNDNIRYRLEGAPSVTVGHKSVDGTGFYIDGANNIEGARFIRDTGNSADAVLYVTYLR